MSGDPGSIEPTSFARLDALASRGRRRSANGDGPAFDALLAEATSRMMKGLSSGAVGNYDTRPKGALGMATPSGLVPATSLPAAASGQKTETTQADAITTSRAETTSVTRPPVTETSTAKIATVDPAITKATVSVAGQSVLQAALDQAGVAYAEGGSDPEAGFDAPGLVRYAYRAVGVEMPGGADSQATMGVAIESIADALPGDLVSFGDPTDHVALYAGNENIVHAPSADEPVRVEGIERPVESIRRVVTPGSGPVTQIEFTPGEMEQLYQPLFDTAGGEWNVEPELLAAIAETESNFNPVAVSPAGAQGLMQFMPATAREMNVDPWDPASAIDGAARYMRTSLDQFEQPELAIASYNAGRGAVSKHGGIPPFTETQNYVRKVVDAWRSRS